MNGKSNALFLAAAVGLAAQLHTGFAASQPFTYQGFLENLGSPIHGNVDLTFRLYDGPDQSTSQLLDSVSEPQYPIASGVLTIDLDFPGVTFDGSERWLEIEVDGEVLQGRIPILPAPYASSANALRGRAVSSLAPHSGDVLRWNGSAWTAFALGEAADASAGEGLEVSQGALSVRVAYRLPQSCQPSQVPKWDGSAWICADQAGTPIVPGTGIGLSQQGEIEVAESYRLPQSCTSGEVAEWTGTNWDCSTPVSQIPGPGVGLQTDAQGNLEITESFRLPQSCAAGEIAKLNGNQWQCLPDLDTTYAPGPGLTIGPPGNTFYLTQDQRLPLGGCPVSGMVPKWQGIGWECGLSGESYQAGNGLLLSPGNTFELAGPYRLPQSCPAGWVPKWDGFSWSCGEDESGPSYTAGHGIEIQGNTISVGPGQLLPTGCVAGQIAAWTGTGWTCTSDQTAGTLVAGPGIDIQADQVSVVFDGSGAAPSAARSDHSHYGVEWEGSDAPDGLTVRNESALAGASAIRAVNSGGHPGGVGLYAESQSEVDGVGVLASSPHIGTRAIATGSSVAVGVDAIADAPVAAVSVGIIARSLSASSNPANSYGGIFSGGYGVLATGTLAGLRSEATADDAVAVHASATATSGQTRGVVGTVQSPDGVGVSGNATAVAGDGVGVYGLSSGDNGIGVMGRVVSTEGGAPNLQIGVKGEASGRRGVGVHASGPMAAVWAEQRDHPNSSPAAHAVIATSESPHAVTGSFVHFASGNDVQLAGNSYAIQARGDVHVVGMLSKSGGTFLIDHPLDPENKMLAHSFVESDEMMNIYSGNIVTDTSGLATVVLPDWFEALNRDIRYQLTVFGQFAQAIVHEKVKNNRFVIRTDRPGVEVSWMVTGVRQDPWAEANRVQVERLKNEEDRGYYLNPEVYGAGREKGLNRNFRSEIVEGIQ